MRKIIIFLLLLAACSNLAPQAAAPQPDAAVFNVLTHPDGALYAGDRVSFEVYSPAETLPEQDSLEVSFAGKILGQENFAGYGMGGRNQATFYWVWDTRGLTPGKYTLQFTLLPEKYTWEEIYILHPANQVPAPEPGAHWATASSNCCILHYISGTDAETDLETLKKMLDSQAADVERRLGVKFKAPIPVTFLPRTLGQGGFTSDGIYISYLRQNYAGSTSAQVSHHELVHWLDSQVGGFRPSILQEGLAVYLSDGHFKIEPILPRAAALLQLGDYVPLRKLADSFYNSQHEAGYAESAAFIGYLVANQGWDKFSAFYRDIQPDKSNSDADAIDQALQRHYGLTLDQVEQNFLDYLRRQEVSELTRRDVSLTISFYDTVRRYEKEMDPSAYFLTTWLPDVAVMRQENIVADFLRHPDSIWNRTLEKLLVNGDIELRKANYDSAGRYILLVNRLLDLRDWLEIKKGSLFQEAFLGPVKILEPSSP